MSANEENEMKIEYEYVATIDVAEAVSSVGALMREVNAELTKFGVSERLTLGAPLTLLTVSCNRELSTQEVDEVKKILDQEAAPRFRSLHITSTELRRKSGNVQQSVS